MFREVILPFELTFSLAGIKKPFINIFFFQNLIGGNFEVMKVKRNRKI